MPWSVQAIWPGSVQSTITVIMQHAKQTCFLVLHAR